MRFLYPLTMALSSLYLFFQPSRLFSKHHFKALAGLSYSLRARDWVFSAVASLRLSCFCVVRESGLPSPQRNKSSKIEQADFASATPTFHHPSRTPTWPASATRRPWPNSRRTNRRRVPSCGPTGGVVQEGPDPGDEGTHEMNAAPWHGLPAVPRLDKPVIRKRGSKTVIRLA
jgi:hypothetical protein